MAWAACVGGIGLEVNSGDPEPKAPTSPVRSRLSRGR